jgi:hypothetical protein
MPPQVIIAKYSLRKTLPPVIICTGLVLTLYLLPAIFHQGPLEFVKTAHANGPGIVFGWIIGPFVLAVFYRIFAQIAFRQRAAIWMDGDLIMNASENPTSTNRHDVESVTLSHVKRYGIKFPAIRLGLKSGEERFLPIFPLVDDRNAVVARLKDVVAGL